MPVTLEIAGRAVSRIGDAAGSVPYQIRDVTNLASPVVVHSGATDNNGYFVSPLLDDAKEYRAEVTYDPGNAYKVLRDISSGQMNMLQVRKRLHVRGAATPAVFDGPVTIATTVQVSGSITGPLTITGNAVVTGVLNAAQMQIGGQNLDDRFYNEGAKVVDSDKLDGLDSTAFATSGHGHPGLSPTTHDHAGTYALNGHTHPDTSYEALIESTSYQGDNTTTGRTVYTAPAGWAIMAAIIQEQLTPYSIFFCTRPQSGPALASPGTGLYGNTGPGADEVQGSSGWCFITADGLSLTIGATNAPLAMNFNPSYYNVTVFLGKNLPG